MIFINMIDITKLNKKQIDVLVEQIAPKQFAKPKPVVDLKFKTTAEQVKNIAKDIYDSKQWLADDEQRAVNAIKRIRDNKQFELVQTELRKLTSGRGIGQYVTSFIEDGIYQAHISLNYVNAILAHLKKIKANPMTINMFTTIQYKLLIKKSQEDKEDQAMGGTELRQFWKDHHHDIMLAASVGALFIPGIGLLISAGISLGDAGMYYQEGNRYQAGLAAGFAILPGLGKLVTLSKPIAKLGAKGMAALGTKLATSSKPVLNRLEMAVIKDMSKYQNVIKSEMNTYFKARAANEAAKIASRAGSKGAKKIIQKIADGSVKASVVGVKTAGQMAGGIAAFDLFNKGWDKVYVNLGFDQKDLQNINKTSLQGLKNVKEGLKMNSKQLLEKVIKETIQQEQLRLNTTTPKVVTTKLKSPFKNQAEGDKFRQWLNLNKPSAARDLKLDKTGPYDNETIIKAYNLHGKDYKNANTGPLASGELTSLQWAGIILVGLVAGVATFSIIKMAAWKTKLIYKNIKSLVPWIKKTKTSDIKSLINRTDIDEATKKELLLALENPRLRVEIQGELNRLLINGFKKNEGIQADDLMKVLSPEEQAIYGPDIRRIQAARDKASGKASTSSKITKPIKISNVSRDAKWTSAQAFNLTLDQYAAEIANSKTGIYSINDIIAYKKGMPSAVKLDFDILKIQFAKPVGSKDGVWLLNKHVDANAFPNFTQWRQDLIKSNPKLNANVLNDSRYRRAKAKWYMIKNY